MTENIWVGLANFAGKTATHTVHIENYHLIERNNIDIMSGQGMSEIKFKKSILDDMPCQSSFIYSA